MLELKDGSCVLDYNECSDKIEFINYSFKNMTYSKRNPALRIYFKDDMNHNVRIIKDLIRLKKENISFCSEIDGKKIRYIISNYPNDSILKALEAIFIEEKKERISFLYDTIFDELDVIWKNINPCGFCNNKCVGIDHRQSPGDIDGCCYSFDYPKHPMFSLNFIENIEKCKHYNTETRRCGIKNLSCKFYVCSYVKKTTSFNIDIDDFLLVNSFFSKKQKLILKYNYFRTREEIIDKLCTVNHIPYFIYYWKSYYRISKTKK